MIGRSGVTISVGLPGPCLAADAKRRPDIFRNPMTASASFSIRSLKTALNRLCLALKLPLPAFDLLALISVRRGLQME